MPQRASQSQTSRTWDDRPEGGLIHFAQGYIHARKFDPSEADAERIAMLSFDSLQSAFDATPEGRDLRERLGKPVVEISIEEGSLKARLKAFTTSTAFLAAVSYTVLHEVVSDLVHDGRGIVGFANNLVLHDAGLRHADSVAQRRTETPGHIQRIIDGDRHGEVQPQVAADSIVAVLRADDPTIPEALLSQLRDGVLRQLTQMHGVLPPRRRRVPESPAPAYYPIRRPTNVVFRIRQNPKTGKPEVYEP